MVKAVIVATNEENRRQVMTLVKIMQTEIIRPWTGGPALKQLVFDWNAREKHAELKSFEMAVTSIYLMKHYELSGAEKVPNNKNWLKKKGLQLTQILVATR